MTDIEKALAMGLFEGEGTISIMRPRNRNFGSLCVSVVNTERAIVDYFQSRWGGVIRKLNTKQSNRKTAWRWILSSRQAERYLLSVQPFALTSRMKERIFLGLAFQGNKWGMSRWATDEEKDNYWKQNVWFYLQFRHLNQRGCTEADSFRRRG